MRYAQFSITNFIQHLKSKMKSFSLFLTALVSVLGALLFHQTQLVSAEDTTTDISSTTEPSSHLEVQFIANRTSLDFGPFEVLCQMHNYTINDSAYWEIFVAFSYKNKDGRSRDIAYYEVAK